MKNNLSKLLRMGGYILYARHAEATVGEDHAVINFQNCFTQRNLSEVGRKQARFYGEILRQLRVPILYPILTSPFCRTIETAQLAFNPSNILTDPFLLDLYRLGGSLSEREQERILTHLRAVLEKEPSHRRNKVMVAHSFQEGIGLGQLPNMGTVVVKPRGLGKGYEIVDLLTLADLKDLLI
ncbi:histidine phosphatase family protein [Bacillus sp. Marseille-P3661]|uniref:histidine phosphatase family protein n=1 Tax=Bacillus sp. Marseille-P3661 TaxID=1936234 RepID=UPI000C851695|nr:histidine phosphatase family protein [Bacillus sp. Marseille-P3661]